MVASCRMDHEGAFSGEVGRAVGSVEDHYEGLLARHFTWMRGDFGARAGEYRRFFARIGVSPRPDGKALDLGTGSGFQSVALADLGFEVLAVDTSETLLGG